MDTPVQPPVTLEGWYALHQVFVVDRRALRLTPHDARRAAACAAADVLERLTTPADGGWSAVARLVGSLGDVLLMHFRPTLDALGDAREELARLALFECLRPVFVLASVTELGLYHATAHGGPGSGDAEAFERRLQAERESPHARRRLYPEAPAGAPWVSFYPTSKRRDAGQNWYALPLEERSALMQRHGAIGRRHAGAIRQVVTGAIGLDAWEWGVTLFADDPLALKRVVTDMRYDETSARYATFGDFYLGRVVEPRAWALSLAE